VSQTPRSVERAGPAAGNRRALRPVNRRSARPLRPAAGPPERWGCTAETSITWRSGWGCG